MDVAAKNLPFYGDMDRIMVNDSGNTNYAVQLEQQFPEFRIISHENRRGMAGVVRSGGQRPSKLPLSTSSIWRKTSY